MFDELWRGLLALALKSLGAAPRLVDDVPFLAGEVFWAKAALMQ
jgi:hypothetical protein